MIIGLISDIHEDIGSLKKALHILEKRKCDTLIALGDITGFEPEIYSYRKTRNASEVIRMIRENCEVVIRGNHDLFAIRELPQSRFGFDYPGNWYDLPLEQREASGGKRVWLYERDETDSRIGDEEKEYIRSLPEYSTYEVDGTRLHFSHYLFPDLTGSSNILPPDKNMVQSHISYLNDCGCRISFFGHLHAEGHWRISRKESQLKPWGRSQITEEITAIGVPGVCRGTNKHGILVFDTRLKEIHSHRLSLLR